MNVNFDGDFIDFKTFLHNPLFQSVIDSLSVGIGILDYTGVYLCVNNSYVKNHGVKQKIDFLGKNVSDLFSTATVGTLNVIKTCKSNISPSVSFDGIQGICSRIPVVGSNGKLLGVITETITTTISPENLNSLINTLLDLSTKAAYYQKIVHSTHSLHTFESIIGQSAEMKLLKKIGKKYAKTQHPILITGETGTGKELLAQAVHSASSRSRGPFVTVNCAALPHDLLESELFGYTEGSFTGARKHGMKGKFETADHGTIFLDEIGETTLEMQAKLLRVLESGEIQKLGLSRPIFSDFRLIAATNQNLEALVSAGKFRQDLFHRLCALELHLPPLRNRQEDIPLLIKVFLEQILGRTKSENIIISNECLKRFQEAHWTGNIRELRNVLTAALCAMDDAENVLRISHLPTRFLNTYSPNVKYKKTQTTLRKASVLAERDTILAMLSKCNQNKTMTAIRLGISRASLYRKLKQYNII